MTYSKGPQPPDQSRPVRNWAMLQEVSLNVMCLNHPQTIPIPPPLVHGKIVFHETGPWCQKSWGPLIYSIRLFT